MARSESRFPQRQQSKCGGLGGVPSSLELLVAALANVSVGFAQGHDVDGETSLILELATEARNTCVT